MMRDDAFERIRYAASMAGLALPPVYIISHNRPEFLPTLKTLPFLRSHAMVVVAEEQRWAYEFENNELNFLSIPPQYRGHGYGVGRARQFCLDHAMKVGYEHVVIMDDDVAGFTMQYINEEGKSSTAFAKHVVDWRDDFRLGIFTLLTSAAEGAFQKVPGMVFVGPQIAPGWLSPESADTAWMSNRGRIPCHVVCWNVPRFARLTGGVIDLENFNMNAEDLWAVMSTLWAGGSMAKAMAITAHPSGIESVVQGQIGHDTDAMYQKQYDALMATHWGHLLYTKFVDGKPQWSRPDWRKINREVTLPKISQPWPN